MKVFILGAGFSHEAGYPLAKNLLLEMAEMQKVSRVNDAAKRWQEFENWRNRQIKHSRALKEIFLNENPEYLLTYLDTICMADESRDNQLWAKAFDAERAGKDVTELLSECTKHQRKHKPESIHRKTILDALCDFLGWRHYNDWEKEVEWADGWIYKFFEHQVKDDDIIITFNYDAIAERCLLKLRKWWPCDGYGFPVELEPYPYQEIVDSSPSIVKVLKLHGSLGWKYYNKKMWLESDFLSHLGIYYSDNKAKHTSSSKVAILIPSFIKPLAPPVVAQLWQQASEALRKADEVIFIGYSLPYGDQAAEALFTSTLADRECPITVVDPSHHTLPIWQRYKSVIRRDFVPKHMKFSEWVEGNG